MRIAIVHSFYSSENPSGENQAVLAQADALRGAGHEVILIARHTDDERSRGLYTLRAGISVAFFRGVSPEQELRAFQPDIIHVHNLFPNWGSSWMKVWSDRTVVTLHNYRTVCPSGILWRDGASCTLCLDNGTLESVRHRCYRGSAVATLPLALASRQRGKRSPLLRHSACVVVLNSDALDLYRELMPSTSVELVPNFVEDVEYRSASLHDSWIFAGRLVPEKGILWLLDNWPASEKLKILGSGPLEREVQDIASGQPDQFEFLGPVSSEKARRLIGSAKGLVLPSLWSEGIPTVALEALQAGTPLLVSDRCSAVAELLSNRSGVSLRIEEGVRGLDNAMKVVVADQEYRQRARSRFVSEFSESVWLERMEEIYSRVAGLKV